MVRHVKFASTNQKYYPDPGSEASSVWNLCACLSEVISRVTSGGVAKCQLFSPARIVIDMIIDVYSLFMLLVMWD